MNEESAITLVDALTVCVVDSFNSICQRSGRGRIPQMDEESRRGGSSVLCIRVQQEYRLVG